MSKINSGQSYSTPDPQLPKETTWDEKALRDAREIGRILRDKHNMQPSHDQDGKILPPPSMFDLKTQDLGKSNMIF